MADEGCVIDCINDFKKKRVVIVYHHARRSKIEKAGLSQSCVNLKRFVMAYS